MAELSDVLMMKALEDDNGQPCLSQCHAPCVSCIEGFGGLLWAPPFYF